MGFEVNGEILVYVMPVGNIPMELYGDYLRVLQGASVIPISSLTRPGGYSAELSPFRSLSWESSQSIKYRFIDMNQTLHMTCEEVHATYRPLALIGICHCPKTDNLRQAYQHFISAAGQFPTIIVRKCFAFEHGFGAGTLDDIMALEDLVMFPLAAPLADGHTTVTLHLQVILDSMTVTILMSLESAIRATIRQHQQTGSAASIDQTATDAQLGVLHTQVDPQFEADIQASLPLPVRSTAAPSRTMSGNIPPTPSASGAGTGLLGMLEKESRGKKRLTMRQRKLMGDYSVMLGCYQDAIDFYVAALDGLRDEERRTSASLDDYLWLAAALEGYVTTLVLLMTSPSSLKGAMKLNVEIIEKASEAVCLYAKAHCFGLESRLISFMGWYYIDAYKRLIIQKGVLEESSWVRQLAIEAQTRLLICFPRISISLRLNYLLDMAAQCAQLRFIQKQALYLHEAASLLVFRHRLQSSPKLFDLQAALALDQTVLGLYQNSSTGWFRLKLYVLRQLIAVGRLCNATAEVLVGNILELLHLLSTVESNNEPTSLKEPPANIWNDALLEPFTHLTSSEEEHSSPPLHAKPFSVYFSPPATYERDVRRSATSNGFFNVKHLPATMAQVTTPRILATPRQLMTAVMNVQSGFSSAEKEPEDVRRQSIAENFQSPQRESGCIELYHDINSTLWQQACWSMLQTDSKCKTNKVLPLSSSLLHVHRIAPRDNLSSLFHADTIAQLTGVEKEKKAAFMYNPFQQKESVAKAPIVYALGDVIEIQLDISNLLNIPVDVSLEIMCNTNAFCYKTQVSMAPREEYATVTLSLRSLCVGEVRLLGFYCILQQMTLRYDIKDPIVFNVVPALPKAEWFVDQYDSVPTLVSMFATEAKSLNLNLCNKSDVLDMENVLLQISIHRKSEGFHAPVSILMTANTTINIPDFTIEWDPVHLSSGKLSRHESLAFKLHFHVSKPDFVQVKIRALFCGPEPSWYRGASVMFMLQSEQCLSIISASANSVDIWNPVNIPFTVQSTLLPPLSFISINLDLKTINELQWNSIDGAANGKLLINSNLKTHDNSGAIDILCNEKTMELYVYHSFRVISSGPLIEVTLDIEMADASGYLYAPPTCCMVAGTLKYSPSDSTTHRHDVQITFLQSGSFRICANGSFADGRQMIYRRNLTIS
ncbi:hypothetical protein THRCLA_00972 [Thraustotheca clavata]|uniref:Trs120/TRAPPC9 N-terminal domain-containing protein n=1 Tax=Thraustotheca clavata TaxID=74557 RepID=A0A1W0A9Y5_9STRA|nr:hypothetical protein THRCLA_00972 [Thraustotheca clavata]